MSKKETSTSLSFPSHPVAKLLLLNRSELLPGLEMRLWISVSDLSKSDTHAQNTHPNKTPGLVEGAGRGQLGREAAATLEHLAELDVLV